MGVGRELIDSRPLNGQFDTGHCPLRRALAADVLADVALEGPDRRQALEEVARAGDRDQPPRPAGELVVIGPWDPKHLGDGALGQRDLAVCAAVMHFEKPAANAAFDLMSGIAQRRLLGLRHDA